MIMIDVALGLLAAAGIALLARLVRGPSVADRIAAGDAFLIIVVALLAVNAARDGSTLFIDVALVISLLAFVGTGIAARFIEQRGA